MRRARLGDAGRAGLRERGAVFLDRDGVLVETTVVGRRAAACDERRRARDPSRVSDACARLREAGFLLVVVTNQPDIARGTADPRPSKRSHQRAGADLPLDEIAVCPHDDADGCDCRKPQPGMLLAAASVAGSTLPRALSSAIAGATSRPRTAPGVVQFSSTAATTKRSPSNRMCRCPTSSKPPSGSCGSKAQGSRRTERIGWGGSVRR